MTDNMKKLLTKASGDMGLPQGVLISENFEAARLGWIEYWKTPQNSMTARFRITEKGRAALGAA